MNIKNFNYVLILLPVRVCIRQGELNSQLLALPAYFFRIISDFRLPVESTHFCGRGYCNHSHLQLEVCTNSNNEICWSLMIMDSSCLFGDLLFYRRLLVMVSESK